MMGSASLLNLLGVFLLSTVVQCKTPAQSQSSIEQLVRRKIGSSYSVDYNPIKTLGLYAQKFTPQKSGREKVKFIVVELSSNKIVKEGSYLNGHVKWRDNTTLEVLDIPGISKKGQSTSDFTKVIYLKDFTQEKP